MQNHIRFEQWSRGPDGWLRRNCYAWFESNPPDTLVTVPCRLDGRMVRGVVENESDRGALEELAYTLRFGLGHVLGKMGKKLGLAEDEDEVCVVAEELKPLAFAFVGNAFELCGAALESDSDRLTDAVVDIALAEIEADAGGGE